MNRVQKKLEGRTTLLGAGGGDRPDAFAPAAAGFAARALRDLPVDDYKADRVPQLYGAERYCLGIGRARAIFGRWTLERLQIAQPRGPPPRKNPTVFFWRLYAARGLTTRISCLA